ncbi:hypothetical protein Tco_0992077 [Tanacetum coccineum]|uniref:Uncharacterized protein n=1 Tax=Tanacetum coccineum TaxID=301880 RepID=A0ABQ5F1S7_9ASTR
MANNETECSPSDVCLSYSDESKNKKGQKDKGTESMKDEVSQEYACEEEVVNHGGDELVDKRRPLNRKRVYAKLMDDALTEYERQC